MTGRKSNIKPRDFYVYLHRRNDNGAVFYVGKGHGKRSIEKSGRSNHWKNIVSKHGYTIEIHSDCLLEWYSYELEIELISYYGRENLCNQTDGGDGTKGSKRNFSQEHKKKLSDSQSGKTYSDFSKSKMSKSRIGRFCSGNHPRAKSVICSNGMSFKAVKDAEKWLKESINKKADSGAISRVCKGSLNSAYGFKWSYA